MRGRILMAIFLGAAALAACSRKDSLYIEPGKESSEPPPKAAPAKAPAKPGPGKAAASSKPAP